MIPSPGKTLILAGVILIIVGVIMNSNSQIPWLGRLPGDIARVTLLGEHE